MKVVSFLQITRHFWTLSLRAGVEDIVPSGLRVRDLGFPSDFP